MGLQPRERDILCKRCFSARTWNNNAICDACRARSAIGRLTDRMDELVSYEDYEPEPQFDTWEEHWGER